MGFRLSRPLPMPTVILSHVHGLGVPSKNTTCSPTSNNNCNSQPQGAGCTKIKTARALLYEICAANCWEPLIFECCQETGPNQLKGFTFKVSFKIAEDSDIIAAYGSPHLRKKDAAENAAEGTLWYLKNAGYL